MSATERLNAKEMRSRFPNALETANRILSHFKVGIDEVLFLIVDEELYLAPRPNVVSRCGDWIYEFVSAGKLGGWMLMDYDLGDEKGT